MVSAVNALARKVKIKKDPEKGRFIVRERGGINHVDFTKAPEEDKTIIYAAIRRLMGRATVTPNRYDFDYLAKVHVTLREKVEDEWGRSLPPLLEEFFKTLIERFEELKKEGEKVLLEKRAEFLDVPLFLIPGQKARVNFQGVLIGAKITGVSLHQDWMDNKFYRVALEIIQDLNGKHGPAIIAVNIFEYEGWKAFVDLPVAPIMPEEEEAFAVRGEKVTSYLHEASYVQYTGQMTRPAWWGAKSYRADGRVMIDSKMFHKIDKDGANDIVHRFCLDDDRRNNDGSTTNVYKSHPSDYWRTLPFVMGFSFRAKVWGLMEIDNVSPLIWRKDAFDILVMAPKQKEIIRALVEHSGEGFTDIVEGKGGGIIFLLAGPPGTGKTATAETVAEVLQRPLYSVSVGELGVSPDQLEARLRTILDVATAWNAVILLDEADIYLEARDERDLVRNAMVGVFLRLLEYHQGVLFLTTNRVKNIDKAFYSRVSVSINYDLQDEEKRAAVWTNLLKAAGFKTLPDIEELAKEALNGRQIKNCIRLAQVLAKHSGRAVDTESMKEVILLATRFEKERKAQEDGPVPVRSTPGDPYRDWRGI